jgi:uncharacterized OsmC-like protein
MSLQSVAAAIQRCETVFRRRPDIGLHEDSTASARWQQGTRALAVHANGTQVLTDMPKQLGGEGEHVTPGWLFRAGLASCAVTSIAMHAATRGIDLTALEVEATSHSDSRGLLGMAEPDGTPVYAGPLAVCLLVRICANGVPAETLRSLVEEGLRCSPIPNAVQNAVPLELSIEVETDKE